MKSIKLALGIAILGVPSIQAATIAWSSTLYTTTGFQLAVLDTGIIATTGTQIFAENSGGSALTFDGISFAAGGITFGSNNATAFYSSAATAAFAPSATYGGGAGGVTVPLTGLTLGDIYRVQVLLFDGRTGAEGSYVRMDDQNMGVYGNGSPGNWGPGLLVTGTFTADANTQNFNLKGNYAGGGVNNMMNGILLHKVPEPSAALLGGLGLLALLRRRR
jgi:hypothetical protein